MLAFNKHFKETIENFFHIYCKVVNISITLFDVSYTNFLKKILILSEINKWKDWLTKIILCVFFPQHDYVVIMILFSFCLDSGK